MRRLLALFALSLIAIGALFAIVSTTIAGPIPSGVAGTTPHAPPRATSPSLPPTDIGPERLRGLGTARDRIVRALDGDPAVEAYSIALADAWSLGPMELSPSAEHAAVFGPCWLLATVASPPNAANSSAEFDVAADPEWVVTVTRGHDGHMSDCAMDVTRKPEAVKAVERQYQFQ